jgi:hypothetical protein
MKKVILGIFCLSFCLCIYLFLRYDSERFNYGWGCDFCNKSIPFGLTIESYNTSNALLDEDEYNIVGKGFRYQTTNFIINDFLGFGYNDTSVVVKCTDSLNTIRYLISYETGYKSKKGNPEISFKDLSNNDYEQVKGKYNWVVFSHEEAQKATFKRFLSFLGALLSLILIVWRLFKLRSKKATN